MSLRLTDGDEDQWRNVARATKATKRRIGVVLQGSGLKRLFFRSRVKNRLISADG
jgi:hypothetical protein